MAQTEQGQETIRLNPPSFLSDHYSWSFTGRGLGSSSSSCSLTDHGRESGLDGRDRTSRATSVTLEEEETGILRELGIGRFTRMTCHILLDVLAENVFDVLLLETALEDEAIVAVNGSRRSEFSEKKLENMFRLAFEQATNLGIIGKRCLLRTGTGHLWRFHDELSGLVVEIGILLSHNGKDHVQQLIIGIVWPV